MEETKGYIVIGLVNGTAVPFGTRQFRDLPRKGDWVEIANDEGHAYFWEVVQVAHSANGDGSDIYVGTPQLATEARIRLPYTYAAQQKRE
jgi:hypothetical protein